MIPFKELPSSIQLMLEEKCSNATVGWKPNELFEQIYKQKNKSVEEISATFNLSLSLVEIIKKYIDEK